MIALVALAQLLDLATYRPDNEYNPLVLALGPVMAPLAKLALVAYLVAFAVVCRRARLTRPVLGFAIVMGLFGAWSNL